MATQLDRTELANRTTDSAYDAPINFWDDPEELGALVRVVTNKVLKRHYVDDFTYVTTIDELYQVGWEALLSAKAIDPLMRKGRVICRMKQIVRAYLLKHVLNLTQITIPVARRGDGKKDKHVKLCYASWELARDEAAAPTSYNIAEVLDRCADREAEQLIPYSRNPEAVLVAREVAAEWQAQTAAEPRVTSSFLFHQIGDGLDVPDLFDGDYPGMEEALFIMLCAMHQWHTPGWTLNRSTKRRFAYTLVARLQGQSNIDLAAEQGRTRTQIGSDVGLAKKGLKQWYNLSRKAQVEALQTLYEAYPDLAMA